MGLDTTSLVAGATRARSIVQRLKADIEAPTAGGQLATTRERLDAIVRSTQNAESAAKRLGGEWRRMGSDQTLWRHYQGGPGSQGSSLADSAIKAVASYHALRVTIFSVADGAKMFREHMEKTHQEASGLYQVAGAIEHSFHEASKSMHSLVGQVFRNVYNFATGDISELRDEHADKQAAQMSEQLRYNQQVYAERKRLEDEFIEYQAREQRELENLRKQHRQAMMREESQYREMQFQLEEKRYGENERRVRRDAFLNQTVLPNALLDEAKRVDRILAKRKAIQDINEEGLRLQSQIDEMERSRAEQIEEQLRRPDHGGAAANVLGSVAEYQARLKAMQAGGGTNEEQQHRRRVERLLEKMNDLQAQLVKINQTGDHVFRIPGAQ